MAAVTNLLNCMRGEKPLAALPAPVTFYVAQLVPLQHETGTAEQIMMAAVRAWGSLAPRQGRQDTGGVR
jgi:hypothetical protein